MKKWMFYLLSCMFVLGACTKTEVNGDDGEEIIPDTFGDPVWVSAEANTATTVNYEFEAGWQIRNACSWLEVSPLSGFAGQYEFSFSANANNTGVTENSGYIDLIVGETETLRLYVFQRGVSGSEASTDEMKLFSGAADYTFTVRANEDFTVESTESWLQVTVSDAQDVLLDDGVSVSEAPSYTVTLSLDENDLGVDRTAEVNVTSANSGSTVSVLQYRSLGSEVPDFSASFFRRSLAARFTATWCSYCPQMAASFSEAYSQEPDRFVQFTVHESRSTVYSAYASSLVNLYGVDAYPRGYVNGYSKMTNLSADIASAALVALVQEAVEELPSKTAIMAEASYTDDVIDVNIRVATKEARQYSLHVYLMESGIVAYQSSAYTQYPGGDDYVHNYVERTPLTTVYGQDFNGTANGVSAFNLSYTVPSDLIEDKDNTYLLIFVTYSSQFTGSVSNIEYVNRGFIVDNVITVGYNEPVYYDYE